MTDKELRILENFRIGIPMLTDEQKEKLVTFGEVLVFLKNGKESTGPKIAV